MKKDDVKVTIPANTFKKILPYVLSFLLSGGAIAGVSKITSPTEHNYTDTIGKLTLRCDSLEYRIINIEAVQRTILIQLSDIKDQGKTNTDLSNRILLTLTQRGN